VTYAEFEQKPVENVQRGTVFALIVIPVGIVAWLVLWNFAILGSIVAFGVAWLAVRLYRFGATVIGRPGAIRIAIITGVTLVLSLFAGIANDVANYYVGLLGDGTTALLAALTPDFWSYFWGLFPTIVGGYLPSILIALLFGAFGCFSVLRNAFMGTKPATGMPMSPLFPRPEQTRPEQTRPEQPRPEQTGRDQLRRSQTGTDQDRRDQNSRDENERDEDRTL
jgi:hypothetical protein